jgi:flagellar biosynthesis/type III secretory pathway protein FliH
MVIGPIGLCTALCSAKALAYAVDESLRLAGAATAALRHAETEAAFAAAGEASGEEGAAEAKARMVAAERARAEEQVQNGRLEADRKGSSSASTFFLSLSLLLF